MFFTLKTFISLIRNLINLKAKYVRSLFAILPLALFLSLFPNNIFVSITAGLVLLGFVYRFSYFMLFYFALIFLLTAPFFWIADYQDIAEKLTDFAFFFLFAGVLGELVFPGENAEANI